MIQSDGAGRRNERGFTWDSSIPILCHNLGGFSSLVIAASAKSLTSNIEKERFRDMTSLDVCLSLDPYMPMIMYR